MVDLAAIGGVVEAVRALSNMTKATAEAIADERQREKLYEIRQGLMDLQARVLDDQMSRMELVAELDRARKELAAERDKKAALDQYELVELAPGRMVYRSKTSEPRHFACPNCRSVHQLVGILQVDTGYGSDGTETKYRCTACTFRLFV